MRATTDGDRLVVVVHGAELTPDDLVSWWWHMTINTEERDRLARELFDRYRPCSACRRPGEFGRSTGRHVSTLPGPDHGRPD